MHIQYGKKLLGCLVAQQSGRHMWDSAFHMWNTRKTLMQPNQNKIKILATSQKWCSHKLPRFLGTIISQLNEQFASERHKALHCPLWEFPNWDIPSLLWPDPEMGDPFSKWNNVFYWSNGMGWTIGIMMFNKQSEVHHKHVACVTWDTEVLPMGRLHYQYNIEQLITVITKS